ncbi:GNAT family N-acetyltransferase [Hyphomonas sp.]|uniref:GNAT family N-acetyltransferase n=1 Tax=Hyphomonas sp. TaxID=87 RepID=UPI0025C5B8A8|nr:GNAT family N-acetyltransferase [Hyphomonas sp.]
MAAHVQIRRANPRDFDALGAVFHAAVRGGATAYTQAQRAAWSPAPRAGEAWAAHLGAQAVWLAEDAGEALGFMTLTPEGYVDLAYIIAPAQGRGLFRQLYTALEDEARGARFARLWTDASLHAKAPFEAVGFVVTRPETVTRGGETFKRFRMEKILDA